jgi:hypothetical protein
MQAEAPPQSKAMYMCKFLLCLAVALPFPCYFTSTLTTASESDANSSAFKLLLASVVFLFYDIFYNFVDFCAHLLSGDYDSKYNWGPLDALAQLTDLGLLVCIIWITSIAFPPNKCGDLRVDSPVCVPLWITSICFISLICVMVLAIPISYVVVSMRNRQYI